jgi:sulfur carrier protein ThiS
MRLHLGGHLNWYDTSKRSWLELDLQAPVRLSGLLEEYGIPAAEVALYVVNGELVELEEALVSNTDRVELYPPVGGG